MSDAFARVLDRTLGDLGVIVFECSDRAAKPLASEIFAHEVTHPGRTWSLAGEAGQRLAAGGYHTQVDGSSQNGAALFRIDGSRTAGRGRRRARAGRRRAHASRDVQPQRAASADRRRRPLPHRVLRQRPERAGVSRAVARGVRAFRRADAAVLSPIERDDSRFGERALSRKARPALRGAAGARRIGAESPARGVAARVGRSRAEGGRRSHRGKDGGDPGGGAGDRCDARRGREIDARENCSTTWRPCAAR